MTRQLFGLAVFVLVAGFTGISSAGDVYVNGYYRADGTYVQPHYRSAPDGNRFNNYGPSQSPRDRYTPSSRDADRDGVANQYDYDDDNDGISDQYDRNPYNSNDRNYKFRPRR